VIVKPQEIVPRFAYRTKNNEERNLYRARKGEIRRNWGSRLFDVSEWKEGRGKKKGGLLCPEIKKMEGDRSRPPQENKRGPVVNGNQKGKIVRGTDSNSKLANKEI